MTEFFRYVISGLGLGFAYAIASMGLTLTFRTSGVFNFAQGAIAAAGAGLFFELHVEEGVPWGIALPVSTLVAGIVVGLALERLGRELSKLSVAAQIAAIIGVLLILEGAFVAYFGNSPQQFPHFFPAGSYVVAGVHITYEETISAAIAIALLVGVTLLLSRTRIGLSMNAVVRDSQLLDLTGMSPGRARRLAWVLGSCFAALSGILLGPAIGLKADTLTLLVVTAFGAAAIGRFTSLPLTFAGALGIGVVGALISGYTSDYQSLQGLQPSLPFLVLFLVLTFATRKQLASMSLGSSRIVSGIEMAGRKGLQNWRNYVIFGLFVVFLLVPAFAGAKLPVYDGGLVDILLFLSLAVLIRMSGQVSLAVVAFAAVGGTTFAHLLNDTPLPWLVCLLLAGLVAVPIGAIIAIPAIRLPGAFLGVASLGFALLLQDLFYPTALMFGSGSRLTTRRPAGLTSDNEYYYVLLAAVFLACGLVVFIQRSRIGRLLRGMAYSPTALTTAGLNVSVTRVLVFAFASFIAAIAGALSGPVTGGVSNSGSGLFTAFNTLTILAILFVCGRTTILSALIGGIFYVLPSYSQSDSVNEYYPIIFGILVIVAALLSDTTVFAFLKGIPAGDRGGRGPAMSRWQAAQGDLPAAPADETTHRPRTPRDPRPPSRTDSPRRPATLSQEGAR